MAQALFLTEINGGISSLPSVVAIREGEPQLAYTNAEGETVGGYCVVAYIPESTCMVLIHTSLDMMAAMKDDDDPATPWVWISDIIEEPANVP